MGVQGVELDPNYFVKEDGSINDSHPTTSAQPSQPKQVEVQQPEQKQEDVVQINANIGGNQEVIDSL